MQSIYLPSVEGTRWPTTPEVIKGLSDGELYARDA